MVDLEKISSVLATGVDAPLRLGVCQALVSVVSETLGARAAMLYSLDKGGRLVLRENFGFSRGVEVAFQQIRMFGGLPLAESVLNSEPIYLSREEVRATIPETASLDLPFEGFLHLSCSALGLPVGGFALAIMGPLDLRTVSPLLLQAISAVGSSHLRELNKNPNMAARQVIAS
jgi:hypothetical protein